MTRYAIDSATALRLIRDRSDADRRYQLVAPSILRSHVMKIRLLGDRVSRATAWKLATELGWEDTAPAEYLAVASLQADALVTEDRDLKTAADGLIAIASYDDLTRTAIYERQ